LDVSYHGGETTEGHCNTEYQEAIKSKSQLKAPPRKDFSKERKLSILRTLMPWWNKALKLVFFNHLNSLFFSYHFILEFIYLIVLKQLK